MDALDPWKLAELYGIDVIPLSTLTVNSAVRDHFNVIGCAYFVTCRPAPSGVTLALML